MPRRITINTIAEQAGVSRGTVDRVLNQRPHVRPDIHQRVVQVMKDLSYIPPNAKQAQALGLTSADAAPCKLGILQPNWGGYFRREILRGIQDAQEYLKPFSVEILIEECETDLPDETMERLDSMLAQGASGIALCAKGNTRIVDRINALDTQGIPIVTFNSDIAGSKRLCFIGQDLVRSGRVAGELMAKYLRAEDRILVAVGNPEFDAHRLRLQGFCEKMMETGISDAQIQIVETYNDYTLTYQKVRDALRQQPALRGIYMANQSVAGCVEAVREYHVQHKIHVISHDLTDVTKRLLENGEIDFTIAQNIYLQGYRSLIVLREYLQRGIFPNPEADQHAIEIICAENMLGRE